MRCFSAFFPIKIPYRYFGTCLVEYPIILREMKAFGAYKVLERVRLWPFDWPQATKNFLEEISRYFDFGGNIGLLQGILIVIVAR